MPRPFMQGKDQIGNIGEGSAGIFGEDLGSLVSLTTLGGGDAGVGEFFAGNLCLELSQRISRLPEGDILDLRAIGEFQWLRKLGLLGQLGPLLEASDGDVETVGSIGHFQIGPRECFQCSGTLGVVGVLRAELSHQRRGFARVAG